MGGGGLIYTPPKNSKNPRGLMFCYNILHKYRKKNNIWMYITT